MTTSQAHRRELILTLEEIKSRIVEAESNCACEVFEDFSEPNRFRWSEWWPSREHTRRAMESERFRALLGAVKVLGSLEYVHEVNRTQKDDREPAKQNQK